jgi:hypothetical protein
MFQFLIPIDILILSDRISFESYLDSATPGILLKPKKPFPKTTLDEVAGCLQYRGIPKSLEDMEDAIRQGVEELNNGNS